MSQTPKQFEKVIKALEAKNIAVLGYDEELEALVLGGLEGDKEYAGIRVEADGKDLIIVLEAVFAAPVDSSEEAVEMFHELYGDLVHIEEEDDFELEFDEEEGLWGTELLRPVEDLDDLVASVEEALHHGMFFDVDLPELEDAEDAEEEGAESKDKEE
jgi:hypothetical protein